MESTMLIDDDDDDGLEVDAVCLGQTSVSEPMKLIRVEYCTTNTTHKCCSTRSRRGEKEVVKTCPKRINFTLTLFRLIITLNHINSPLR